MTHYSMQTATIVIPQTMTGNEEKVVELDVSNEMTCKEAIMMALEQVPKEKRAKLLDSHDEPMQFINCYINGVNIGHNTQGLATVVKTNDELRILSAIKGGCF